MKMVYYKPVKVTIDVSGLTEVIIYVVIHHHKVSKSIVMDRGLLFISKFWSLLYYFLGIKRYYLQPSILKQMAKPRDKIA